MSEQRKHTPLESDGDDLKNLDRRETIKKLAKYGASASAVAYSLSAKAETGSGQRVHAADY